MAEHRDDRSSRAARRPDPSGRPPQPGPDATRGGYRTDRPAPPRRPDALPPDQGVEAWGQRPGPPTTDMRSWGTGPAGVPTPPRTHYDDPHPIPEYRQHPPPGGYRNPYEEQHAAMRRSQAAHAHEEHRDWRTFYTMTAANAFLPGSGYGATGLYVYGWHIAGAYAVVCLGLIAYVAIAKMSALVLLLSSPWLLKAVLMVHVLALVGVCWSTIKLSGALRPSHPTERELWTSRAFVMALCLLICTPTIVGAGYLVLTKNTLDSISHRLLRDVGRGPNLNKADPWADYQRVNLLLLGSDAGANREGIRTDSMMVVSISPKTGDSVTIGIPRNLQNFKFPTKNPMHKVYPNGYNCGNECLLNAVWRDAEAHRNLFPSTDKNVGLTTVVDVLENLLNLTMNQVVVVDFGGFRDAVDAIGGLKVNVRTRIAIGGRKDEALGKYVGITGYIEPGEQTLDGYHAMWFTRSRALDDDFERMKRQRCAIAALSKQMKSAQILARYPALLDVAKEHVKTDIPLNNMGVIGAWLELFNRMQKGTMRSMPLTPKNINVNAPDYQRIHQMVANATSDNPVVETASPTGSTSTRALGVEPYLPDLRAWFGDVAASTPATFAVALASMPMATPNTPGSWQSTLPQPPFRTPSQTQSPTQQPTQRPTVVDPYPTFKTTTPTFTETFTQPFPTMTPSEPTYTVDPQPTAPTRTSKPTRTSRPTPSNRPAPSPAPQPTGSDNLVNVSDAC